MESNNLIFGNYPPEGVEQEPKEISLVPMPIPQKLNGKTADDVWSNG